MKKSLLKLFMALLVSGVSFTSVNAINPTPSSTTVINSDDWKEVQSQNGIKVYFSETEENGKSFLKIKFENTTNQEIEFSWSVVKDSKSITSETVNKIEASSSINDSNITVPFGVGETYADFSINIKIK